MGKIALLLANDELYNLARDVIAEEQLDGVRVKVIDTMEAVMEARTAIDEGCMVIAACSHQAKLIREFTNVPVVNIRLCTQAIGLLLKKAKAIVKKDDVHVGFVAFGNILCDMSYMEELFGVKISVGYVKTQTEIADCITTLIDQRADLLIGGKLTCEEAERRGIPSLRYLWTKESISEALGEAVKIVEAAENERQNSAQFTAMLDTSVNGIIKISADATIIAVNTAIENLLGKNETDINGNYIGDVFPELDMMAVKRILSGSWEDYMVSVELRGSVWLLMMTAIQYDDRITGAILSLHKVGDALRKEIKTQRDMYTQGYRAQIGFSQLHTENSGMQMTFERAKTYALSDSPVMLYSEEGTEYYVIAEAIHNNSARKNGPFVSVCAKGMTETEQIKNFFGVDVAQMETAFPKKSALARANNGTIFIKDIECLTRSVQQQLCRVLISGFLSKTNVQPAYNLNIRLIAYSGQNLYMLVKNGQFCEDLYYMLQGMTLEIPGLNRRPDDRIYYFEKLIGNYAHKYNKHLIITDGARKQLNKLSWKGNMLQLNSFCERLVLTAEKRRIDEIKIQKTYSELYPSIREIKHGEEIVVYRAPEAVELRSVLEKHSGNRTLAAQELGISTTTLWRRMKKYGIESNYT